MRQFLRTHWNIFTPFIVSLACAISLTACGSGADESGDESSSLLAQQQQQQQQQQVSPAPSSTPSPAASPTPSPTPSPTASPSPSAAPATVQVSIPVGASALGANGFGQNPLSVSLGTTVTWINDDTVPHTVTSDVLGEDMFDSGTLLPGQQFSVTFNDAGTIGYHCTIHPGMTGTVVIQ